MRKTPLAWANLTHDARRMATSLAGVTFAVILMFTEQGFLNALLDSTVSLIRMLELSPNDLVLVHHEKETLADVCRFSRRELYLARACPGVELAEPLYLENTLSEWENPITGESLRIRVVAADPRHKLFEIPGKAELVKHLGRNDTAFFDVESKNSFGYDQLVEASKPGSATEAILQRRSIQIRGTFRLGTDFVNDGNLMMGLRCFDRFFPTRRPYDLDFASVDVGIIKLNGKVPPEEVRKSLRSKLPSRVRILTRDELIDREQGFWKHHTPIGPIFILGTGLGFVVGVVICYQILSSDIRDHMAEYATLKAMGYRNVYLIRLVFSQAVWLAFFSLIPGVLFSLCLYNWLSWWTGLPMLMHFKTVVWVGGLTLLMCLLSAYLAIRQLFRMDPAELFR